MSEKRRDQKGRILKTGESQRNDGHYMFRYTDIHKKRRYVYAKTLEELRQKEADIQRDTVDGIDYAAGEMTVIELVTRYMDLKRTLKENSYRAYDTVINRMRKDPFSQKQIRQIKPSDAKAWFVSLHDRGYKQSTISTVQCVVRPAFEMAVDDDGKFNDFALGNGSMILLHPAGRDGFNLMAGDVVTIKLTSNDSCILEFGEFKDGDFVCAEAATAQQHSCTFEIEETGMYCFSVEYCSANASSFTNCIITVE